MEQFCYSHFDGCSTCALGLGSTDTNQFFNLANPYSFPLNDAFAPAPPMTLDEAAILAIMRFELESFPTLMGLTPEDGTLSFKMQFDRYAIRLFSAIISWTDTPRELAIFSAPSFRFQAQPNEHPLTWCDLNPGNPQPTYAWPACLPTAQILISSSSWSPYPAAPQYLDGTALATRWHMRDITHCSVTINCISHDALSRFSPNPSENGIWIDQNRDLICLLLPWKFAHYMHAPPVPTFFNPFPTADARYCAGNWVTYTLLRRGDPLHPIHLFGKYKQLELSEFPCNAIYSVAPANLYLGYNFTDPERSFLCVSCENAPTATTTMPTPDSDSLLSPQSTTLHRLPRHSPQLTRLLSMPPTATDTDQLLRILLPRNAFIRLNRTIIRNIQLILRGNRPQPPSDNDIDDIDP